MMNRFECRILKLGTLVGNLCATAVGGFVFLRGFRLVASEEEELAARSSIRGDGTPGKHAASSGAALFLLTFATSEALVMIWSISR
jgi:hypothetical protein